MLYLEQENENFPAVLCDKNCPLAVKIEEEVISWQKLL